MGQTLSTVTSGRFLAPADAAITAVVHRVWGPMRMSGGLRHDAIPDRLAPTEAERATLGRRLAQIEQHLRPAEPAVIRRAVGMVKGLMASTAVDGQSAREVLDGYAFVLRTFPKALIEDVCGRFLDGRLGNRVYAPTPAEIAHECRQDPDFVAANAERYRIEAVLAAEVYSTPTPVQQAEMQAEYQRYLAEATAASDARPYRPTSAGTQAAERAQAQRDLDRMAEAAKAAPATGAETQRA